MIINDEKILRQLSVPLQFEEIDLLATLLITEADRHEYAAGLSAIQLGIPKRIFITRNTEKPPVFDEFQLVNQSKWSIWVNPIIIESSSEKIETVEGCLSYPNRSVLVRRSKQITVESFESESHPTRRTVLDEFDAVVFQHELDHLNGILMFDRGDELNVPRISHKIGRNELCPCGSGKKFKKCCEGKWISY